MTGIIIYWSIAILAVILLVSIIVAATRADSQLFDLDDINEYEENRPDEINKTGWGE